MLLEEKVFCSNSIKEITQILDGWGAVSEAGDTIKLSEIKDGLTKIIDLSSDILLLNQTRLHSNSEDVLRLMRLEICSRQILQRLDELLLSVPPEFPLELCEMVRYQSDFESISGKLFQIWLDIMSWEQLFLSRELGQDPSAEVFDARPYIVRSNGYLTNYQTDLITEESNGDEVLEQLKLPKRETNPPNLSKAHFFGRSEISLLNAKDLRDQSLGQISDTIKEFDAKLQAMQTLTPIGLSFCLAEMSSDLELLEHSESIVRKLSPNEAIPDRLVEKILEFKNEVVKNIKDQSEYILDWIQGHADVEPDVKEYSTEALKCIRTHIGNKDLCEMSQEDLSNWGAVFQSVTADHIRTIISAWRGVRRSLIEL